MCYTPPLWCVAGNTPDAEYCKLQEGVHSVRKSASNFCFNACIIFECSSTVLDGPSRPSDCSVLSKRMAISVFTFALKATDDRNIFSQFNFRSVETWRNKMGS